MEKPMIKRILTVDCNICNGYGRVIMEDVGSRGLVYRYKQDCPQCIRHEEKVQDW